MANSTYVMYCMKMQAYEKLKYIKNTEKFKSMNEHDFLMHTFDNLLDVTYPNNSPDQSSPNISQHDSSEKALPTQDVTVKIESIIPIDVHENVLESRQVPFVCEDCGDPFVSKVELDSHKNAMHPKNNFQYRCICGQSFEFLQLYLQHSFKCLNLQPQIKLELTTNKKRRSPNELSGVEENDMKRLKASEYNCEDCNRKFRKSSTLYLHQCQKTVQHEVPVEVNEMPETKPVQIVAPEITSTSRNKSNSLLPTDPVLICRCQKRFTDYNEFYTHCQNNCEKTNLSESSYPGNSNRTSPLRVLPNRDGKYECEECPKSFSTLLSLKQHRDGMHSSTPKFICQICGKGYRWCTSFHYHKDRCMNKSATSLQV